MKARKTKKKAVEPAETPKRTRETAIQRLDRLAVDMVNRAELEQDPAHMVTAVRAAALVISEQRKLRAEERKNADAITRAEVLEWFRGLTDGEAESVLRELTLSRKRGSGLA